MTNVVALDPHAIGCARILFVVMLNNNLITPYIATISTSDTKKFWYSVTNYVTAASAVQDSVSTGKMTPARCALYCNATPIWGPVSAYCRLSLTGITPSSYTRHSEYIYMQESWRLPYPWWPASFIQWRCVPFFNCWFPFIWWNSARIWVGPDRFLPVTHSLINYQSERPSP